MSQTFVRRCYGGLGSSRACREPANQKTAGQSAFGAGEVFRGSKSKAPPAHAGLSRRSLANRRLSRPSPVQDLLLCAKHLFVAAMVDWVHPGLPRMCCSAPNICSSLPWWLGFTRACREPAKSGHDGGTGPRSERRRHHRQVAPCPERFVIPRQRFVHGSQGVNFAPAGGRMNLGRRL